MNTEELLKTVETIARLKYDGHYTLLSFTTGYKGAFGTIDLDSSAREQVWNMPKFDTLNELLTCMIVNELSVYDYCE